CARSSSVCLRKCPASAVSPRPSNSHAIARYICEAPNSFVICSFNFPFIAFEITAYLRSIVRSRRATRPANRHKKAARSGIAALIFGRQREPATLAANFTRGRSGPILPTGGPRNVLDDLASRAGGTRGSAAAARNANEAADRTSDRCWDRSPVRLGAPVSTGA